MKRISIVLAALFWPIFTFAAGASDPPTPSAIAQGFPARGPTQGGMALVDPSENAKALSEASNKRQDDLRKAYEEKFQDALRYQAQINDLNFQINKQLREADISAINSELKLRFEYQTQLALAEKQRIDAIRTVDQNNVSVASQRAADQATVLATQVATSAEALRGLVATTAATVAAAQTQLGNTLSARITTLEQGSYAQAGAKTFQDPAFVALAAQVQALSSRSENGVGRGSGQTDVIAWIVAGFSLFIALIAAGAAVFSASRGRDKPVEFVMRTPAVDGVRAPTT
jgi:hypothetical protein